VRSRVPEMAEKVIAALANMETAHLLAEKVAKLIRQRKKGPGQFSELNCSTTNLAANCAGGHIRLTEQSLVRRGGLEPPFPCGS
jgi:hypothetical protein